MPTVSMANFEGEDLLSNRLLSFMSNGEQSNLNMESVYHMSGNMNDFFSASGMSESASTNFNNNSPAHRSMSASSSHDKAPSGISVGSSNEITTYNGAAIGPMSGSCSPPPTVMSAADLSNNFMTLRHNQVGAPYSALTSPSLNSKLASIPQHSLLNLSGAANGSDRHSLQNSPFYNNHYPVNGNLQTHLQRQFPGISPGHASGLFSNGVNNYRGGLYQDAAFSLPGFRSANSNSGCPQRELFPNTPSPHASNNCHNFMGPGLLIQDRLHYYGIAQKHGFIVGAELERIKENSRRSTSQSYGRISAYFRNRYGETEAKTKAAYLQLGVRVPSKDHVSEIVGKGGQKIKLIREETGALITTPGEQEEHVFIIEAPPEIAMRVAHHLATRAQEITQSKIVTGERRRGSTSSQPCVTENCSLSTTGSTITSTVPNLTPNGGITSVTNNFLVPSTGPSSGLLSLGSSASSSPLHPLAVSSALVGNVVPSNGPATVRSPNSNLFNNSAFSSLPASPGNSSNQVQSGNSSIPTNGLFSSTSTPGSRVLLARGRISVPQEMVGKIIGTQGSIITTIQKDTGTEIKSPPKEAARGPNATSEFEISAYQGLGLSSNQAAECRVQQAKQLIGHLVMRQLERRASEEVDETSGSSNLSTEDQRLATGSNNITSGSNTVTTTTRTNSSWMWPDVAQMDSQEAREVLDRILAESKNKTRRAKELAAATSGPSPTSSCSVSALNTPGSILNLANCNGSQNLLPPDQQQSHFQTHLISSKYYDSNAATTTATTVSSTSTVVDCNGVVVGCEDLNSIHQNSSLVNTFNSPPPHGNSITNGGVQFTASHVCTPRGLKSLDLSTNGDNAGHRAPGSSLVSDLWSSAPNFHLDSRSSSVLPGYIGSSSALNNLLNGSPSPSALMQPQTGGDILNGANGAIGGVRGLDDSFDTSIFNFNDLRHEIEADCSSSSSSGLRMLHHQQQQLGHASQQQSFPQDNPQPLMRRHSDWVVNSANLFSELASSLKISSASVVPMTAHGSNHNSTTNNLNLCSFSETATGVAMNDSTITANGLLDPAAFSTNSFNLIQALDQLYLNNNNSNSGTATNHNNNNNNNKNNNNNHINLPLDMNHHPHIGTTADATVSGTTGTTTTTSGGVDSINPDGLSLCPPGFEMQNMLPAHFDSVFSMNSKNNNFNHLSTRELWSNTNLMSRLTASTVHSSSPVTSTMSQSSASTNVAQITNTTTALQTNPDDALVMMQHLFNKSTGICNGDDDQQNVSHCMTNSIWGQTDLVTNSQNDNIYHHQQQQPAHETASNSTIDSAGLTYSYLRRSFCGSTVGHHLDSQSSSNLAGPVAGIEASGIENFTSSNSTALSGGEQHAAAAAARCGAIGEGRRRRRPRSPSMLTDADEMSLSVSSAIASTTEVA